jgi:hypothetical protein
MLLGDKINVKAMQYVNFRLNYAGCDGRYDLNITNDLDYQQLRSINISFNKLRILKKLEDPKISYNEKLREINENYIFYNEIMPNITNGGLFKDWNFTF